MRASLLIGLLVSVVLAGAFLAGQRLGSLCPSYQGHARPPASQVQGNVAAHPMGPDASSPPMPVFLAPSDLVPDRHPEAFMVQDRSGHISSSRVWTFVDDWFTDGGKLGCRRFSTDGATLEFCLDPYHTGSGCPVREGPSIHHTLR